MPQGMCTGMELGCHQAHLNTPAATQHPYQSCLPTKALGAVGPLCLPTFPAGPAQPCTMPRQSPAAQSHCRRLGVTAAGLPGLLAPSIVQNSQLTWVMQKSASAQKAALLHV